MRKTTLLVAGLCLAASSFAQSGSTAVDTRSNVFGYGVGTPSSAGGGGVIAPVIALNPGTGRSITFSVTGTGSWGAQWPTTGPDGTQADPLGGQTDTNLAGVGPISGFKAPKHGHLLGVFVEAEDVSGFASPGTLSYPNLASLGLSSYSPGLRQVFFIGDGLTGTGSGSTQVFNVPNGAVKLALGIGDGFNFSGSPSYYDDNVGSYFATYNAVPEPATLAACSLGLVALLKRRRS